MENVETFEHAYQIIFKGNEAVDIEPKGSFYTMFQRDYYRAGQPRLSRSGGSPARIPIVY